MLIRMAFGRVPFICALGQNHIVGAIAHHERNDPHRLR
jgi:hypothetical protein